MNLSLKELRAIEAVKAKMFTVLKKSSGWACDELAKIRSFLSVKTYVDLTAKDSDRVVIVNGCFTKNDILKALDIAQNKIDFSVKHAKSINDGILPFIPDSDKEFI